MPIMKATQDFKYRGGKVKKGDIIKVKNGDVRLLTAWHFAEEVKKPAPKQEYRTREMLPTPTWSAPEPAKPTAYHLMTKPELQVELQSRGIEYKSWQSKATLIEKLKEQK